MTTKPRVIHFVTGGGSGSTRVAIELACAHLRTGNYEPLLVFRQKKIPLPAPMQAQITEANLASAWVVNGPTARTRRELATLIDGFKPQIFAAHGNSEHLWGRKAAFAAGVPVVLHVEHNCERYLLWRRWAARKLAAKTTATVCVSHGVAGHIQRLGLASARAEVIHNGVAVGRYSNDAPAWTSRSPDIAMMARFAGQKDHPTLIRAARLLADRGWSGQLLLAGGGKTSNRRNCVKLAAKLGLADRVQFLGALTDITPVLHRCRVAVLATYYEGLPLALVEYMSAGCAAVASNVVGVTDIIQPGANGWLVPVGDDTALADTLAKVLAGGAEIEATVAKGQADAAGRFSLEKMVDQYEALFAELGSK